VAAIIDVVLGGSIALAGSIVGTLLQGWLQQRARDDERAEHRREARREKAEQVFTEAQKLADEYTARWMASARQTIEQLKRTIGGDAQEVDRGPTGPSTAKLEALVAIYFPARLPLVEKFNADVAAVVEQHTEQVRTTLEGKQLASRNPAVVSLIFMNMGQEVAKLSTAFAKTLRQDMRSEIDKLW
jgi:hypothetical protein